MWSNLLCLFLQKNEQTSKATNVANKVTKCMSAGNWLISTFGMLRYTTMILFLIPGSQKKKTYNV